MSVLPNMEFQQPLFGKSKGAQIPFRHKIKHWTKQPGTLTSCAAQSQATNDQERDVIWAVCDYVVCSNCCFIMFHPWIVQLELTIRLYNLGLVPRYHSTEAGSRDEGRGQLQRQPGTHRIKHGLKIIELNCWLGTSTINGGDFPASHVSRKVYIYIYIY